jgi:hypothetical protein
MKSKIHLSGFNGKSDGIQETVIVKEASISFRYISNETMCYSSKVNIPFTVSDLGNTDIIIGLVTIAKYFHKDMCNILLELGKLGKQLVDKEENKFVNKLVTHQDTDKVAKEEFSEVSSMIQINMITAVVSDDSESGNTDDTDDPSLVTPNIVQLNELIDAMNAIVVNASPELANDLRILNAEVDFEKYNELLQDCLEEFHDEEDIAVIALRTIHKLRTSILIHVLKNVHNFGVSWNTSFNQTVFNTNQSFVLYSFNDVGILGWLVFGAKRYSMEKVFEVLNYVLDNRLPVFPNYPTMLYSEKVIESLKYENFGKLAIYFMIADYTQEVFVGVIEDNLLNDQEVRDLESEDIVILHERSIDREFLYLVYNFENQVSNLGGIENSGDINLLLRSPAQDHRFRLTLENRIWHEVVSLFETNEELYDMLRRHYTHYLPADLVDTAWNQIFENVDFDEKCQVISRLHKYEMGYLWKEWWQEDVGSGFSYKELSGYRQYVYILFNLTIQNTESFVFDSRIDQVIRSTAYTKPEELCFSTNISFQSVRRKFDTDIPLRNEPYCKVYVQKGWNKFGQLVWKVVIKEAYTFHSFKYNWMQYAIYDPSVPSKRSIWIESPRKIRYIVPLEEKFVEDIFKWSLLPISQINFNKHVNEHLKKYLQSDTILLNILARETVLTMETSNIPDIIQRYFSDHVAEIDNHFDYLTLIDPSAIPNADDFSDRSNIILNMKRYTYHKILESTLYSHGNPSLVESSEIFVYNRLEPHIFNVRRYELLMQRLNKIDRFVNVILVKDDVDAMINDDRIHNLEDLRSFVIVNEDGWFLPYIIKSPYPNNYDEEGYKVDSYPNLVEINNFRFRFPVIPHGLQYAVQQINEEITKQTYMEDQWFMSGNDRERYTVYRDGVSAEYTELDFIGMGYIYYN